MSKEHISRHGQEETRAARNVVRVLVATLLVVLGLVVCGGPLRALADGDGGTQAQAYNLEPYVVGSYTDASGVQHSSYLDIKGKRVLTGFVASEDVVVLLSENETAPFELCLLWELPNDITVTNNTTFTYSLPDGLSLNSGQSGALMDGLNQVGYYVFGEKTITLTYTTDMGSDVYGSITLNGWCSGASVEGTTSFVLSGLASVSFTVQRSSTLLVDKWCFADNVDGDHLRQRWVVQVTSTGSNAGVAVDDVMGEYLSLVGGSIAVYTDATLTQAYTGSYSTTNGGFPLTFDTLGDETVYVAYEASVDDRAQFIDWTSAADVEKVTNTAVLSGGCLESSSLVSKTALLSTWQVTKEGQLSADGTAATWTVLIDTGSTADIAGTTVLDVLGSNVAEPVSGVVVEQSATAAEGSWTTCSFAGATWEALKAGSFTFPSGSTSRYYRIVYTTDLQNLPAVGTRDYTNTVTVYGYGMSVATSASSTVSAGTPVSLVEKTCDTASGTSVAVDWTVTVTVPDGGDLTQASLVDTLPDGLTLDSEQGVLVTADDQGTYAGCTVSVAENGKSFQLVFTNSTIPAGTTLTVTYRTTIDDPASYSGATTFTNKATLDAAEMASAQTATATYTYQQVKFTKSFWWASAENPFAGTLTWGIEIGDMADLCSDGQTVTIVDVLGENTAFDDSYLVVQRNAWPYTAYEGVTTQVSDDGTVTFTVDGEARDKLAEGATLWILYRTKLVDATQASGRYTNRATLYVGDQKISYNAATVQRSAPAILSKTAKYDENTAPTASYTITVNPAGLDLDASSDVLTLTDEMGTVLDLRLDTVRVCTADGDAVEFTFAFDVDANVLSITLPDEAALVVTYDVYVTVTVGEELNSENAGNTATLLGGAFSAVSDKAADVAYASKAESGSTGHSLMVYKCVATDGLADYSSPLAGAEFSVEELSFEKAGDCWTVTGATAVATLTSKENGYTSAAGGLRSDTVYRVTETTAPDGYTVADPIYVVFASQNDYSDVEIVDDGAQVEFVTVSGNLYTCHVGDEEVAEEETEEPEETEVTEETVVEETEETRESEETEVTEETKGTEVTEETEVEETKESKESEETEETGKTDAEPFFATSLVVTTPQDEHDTTDEDVLPKTEEPKTEVPTVEESAKESKVDESTPDQSEAKEPTPDQTEIEETVAEEPAAGGLAVEGAEVEQPAGELTEDQAEEAETSAQVEETEVSAQLEVDQTSVPQAEKPTDEASLAKTGDDSAQSSELALVTTGVVFCGAGAFSLLRLRRRA